jgi:trimethylamine---corrinoid protein Co-methyltransferase
MKGIQVGVARREGWGLLGLTTDELGEIHSGTLDVLQNCGVKVLNSEALDLFDDGGAWVEREFCRVKIPAFMVEDAIESAPKTVLLAARDPAHDVVLQPGRVCFTNFGVGVQINDPYTGELRETTLEDVGRTTLLCDALESVDVVNSPVDARDLPENLAKELRLAQTMLANTSKHIVHGEITSGAAVRKLAEMGAVVAGGAQALRERPLFSTGSCPTSPLELGNSCCEVIMECARTGLPGMALSMPMTGATAPVSLAGLLVVYNAEVLAALVLHQLTRRGAPFIYSASTCSMEMTCGTCLVGSPEAALLNAGVVALARYYLLPNWTAGG